MRNNRKAKGGRSFRGVVGSRGSSNPSSRAESEDPEGSFSSSDQSDDDTGSRTSLELLEAAVRRRCHQFCVFFEKSEVAMGRVGGGGVRNWCIIESVFNNAYYTVILSFYFGTCIYLITRKILHCTPPSL